MRVTEEYYRTLLNRLGTSTSTAIPLRTVQVIGDTQEGKKYGNRKILTEWGWFDSEAELTRWKELKLREVAGEITELKRQVLFVLLPACVMSGRRHRAICFIADYVYVEDGKKKVEDKKGYRNRLYQLKRRLMWQLLGIEVIET